MVSTRYRPKDLKLARRHVVKTANRIAKQEIVIKKLSLKGSPAGSARELLGRLYDHQRRQLDRLKLIEAMVDGKAYPPEALPRPQSDSIAAAPAIYIVRYLD